MKVNVFSFNETRKLCDYFEIEIPNETPCFNREEFLRETYKVCPQLKKWHFATKTERPEPGNWIWGNFKPIEE